MLRNYRLATIGKHTITAFEMTVSQVLSLYFAAGNLKIDDADAEKFNAILINRVFNDDDFLKVSGKLNDKEMAAALDFWKETNKAFFEPDKKSGSKSFATFKHLYKDLAESVANMIRIHHANALDYSWSFFLAAIAASEKEGNK